MTFAWKLVMFGALAAAFALIMRGTPPARRRPTTALSLSLAAVIVALLLVGIVSRTPRPHVVQVVPLAIALAAVVGARGWAIDAARVVLTFWALVMGAIWLFLLGVATIFSGTFTTTEVGLTVIIGLCAFAGVLSAIHLPTATAIPRVGVTIAFAALQTGALWLSYQPMFR
jgi:hypothetical protein